MLAQGQDRGPDLLPAPELLLQKVGTVGNGPGRGLLALGRSRLLSRRETPLGETQCGSSPS